MRDRAQQLHDLAAARAVQVASRLVREDQPRLAGERACDRDALALASGELLRRAEQALAEADAFEPRARSSLGVAHADAAQHQLDRRVLDRGDAGHQVVVLVDEADVPEQVVAYLVLRQRGQVAVLVANGAPLGRQQRRDQQQQRRLAGAARAQQRNHLALRDRQADAVDGAHLLAGSAVVLDYSVELEHRPLLRDRWGSETARAPSGHQAL